MNRIIFVFITIFTLFGFNIFKSKISAEESDYSRHIIELPIQEQLAHQSLIKKLKLIRIHQNYIFSQSEAIIRLMEILEIAKDKQGNLDKSRFVTLVKAADFPEISSMKPQFKEVLNDSFLGCKAKYCLELISENNKDAISRWFELLEEEILNEILLYEEKGMNFSSYKYILGLYTDAKSSLKFQSQMLILMNPKIFNESND